MLKKWIGVVSLFLLMLLSVSFGMVVLAEGGQTRTGVRVSEVGVNSYFYVNFTEAGFTEAAIGVGSYAEWILVDGVAAAGAGGNAFKAGNITDCNNPNGFAFYGITNPSEIVFKAGISDLIQYGDFCHFPVERMDMSLCFVRFHIPPHAILLIPPPKLCTVTLPNSEHQSSSLFQTYAKAV